MGCDGCSFSIHSAMETFTSLESGLDFLEKHGCLLPKDGHVCPCCGYTLRYYEESHLWRCSGKVRNPKTRKSFRCRFSTSRHKGTWLDQSRLSAEKTVMFVNAFMHDLLTTTYAHENLGMSSQAFTDWSKYIRDVCRADLDASCTVLGGQGVLVEVDEIFIGCPESNGEPSLKGQWVLGGFERGSHKVFFAMIPNRSAATLSRNIEMHVAPGTTIITGTCKGYLFLRGNSSFTHITVKQSQKFVDPATGAHIQNIQRAWRVVKSSIPRIRSRIDLLDGYLAAYQWKCLHPNRELRLHDFYVAVSLVYPPEVPTLPSSP